MVRVCGSSGLKLQHLTPDKVAQAFVLVELVASGISRKAWSKFAERRISQTSSLSTGILTVEDPKGIIVGLASYIVDKELNEGRTLTVDQLVTVPIIDQQRDAVLAMLLNAIEDIATNHRDSAIRFRLRAFDSAILDQHAHRLLEASGLSHRWGPPSAT